MRLVVMKWGGEPGDVAINPERVTHIRAASGPFTDIFFGEHHIAVQGAFLDVVNRLAGRPSEGGEVDARR